MLRRGEVILRRCEGERMVRDGEQGEGKERKRGNDGEWGAVRGEECKIRRK